VPVINRLSHDTAFKNKKSGGYLLSNASRFPKEHCFMEGSQALPTDASGKSNMKMSMEHWWNTDGNIKVQDT